MRQANDMNARLQFEGGSSMSEKERELVRMKENYESTMDKLNDKKRSLEDIIHKANTCLQ